MNWGFDMARIRTIKPEFFTSEDIVELDPLARLLYIALWCEADKEGRLSWKPRTFKMRYLPADDCDIDATANALVTRGLIVLYGDGLAYIPSFRDHQHINPREKESVLPDPDACSTRHSRVSDKTVTHREEGRKEGKGKESYSPDADASGEVKDRRSKPRGTDEDYKVARWLFGIILAVNQTAKQPNWDTWANEVRLLREVDGRTHREICELFKFAKADSFWSHNIQSPAKLRDKWDVLTELKAKAAPPPVAKVKDWE